MKDDESAYLLRHCFSFDNVKEIKLSQPDKLQMQAVVLRDKY